MLTEEFRAYARDRLIAGFPEWYAWLRHNVPPSKMAAAIDAYGQRMRGLSLDQLEHVVCLVLAGKRQRPKPELLPETLANYAERIEMDASKQRQARRETAVYRSAREYLHATDGPDWRDWQQAWRQLMAEARAGGAPELPCYEPECHRACKSWAQATARNRRLLPTQHAEATVGAYREVLRAAGVVLDSTPEEIVRHVPEADTWAAGEIVEAMEGEDWSCQA